VQIRHEGPSDHAAVSHVHRVAFGVERIVALVDGLRRSLGSELGLSLVAVDDDDVVVGHVMFTRNLLDASPRLVDVQVLSPLAVRPDVQRQGTGSALVRRGLRELDEANVPAVFLEGSPAYYSRLGFVPGHSLGFRRPSLRIPKAAFQVQALSSYAPWMSGTLVYRHEFWQHDAVGLRDA
jgi:putative acetyltransferase